MRRQNQNDNGVVTRQAGTAHVYGISAIARLAQDATSKRGGARKGAVIVATLLLLVPAHAVLIAGQEPPRASGAAPLTSAPVVPPNPNELAVLLPPVTTAQSPAAVPDAAATKHTLTGTYLNEGNWAGAPFAGDNIQQPVDTQLTLVCPGSSTCTIYAGISVQVGGVPTAPASEGGLCIYVDGAAAYCGDVNQSQPAFLQNFVQLIHFSGVAPGMHTVQTYLFSGANTYVWGFSTEYQVLTP